MASLKTEFLAHYHDSHGVPLRSRMFGSVRRLEPDRLRNRAAGEPARRRSGRAPAAAERWLGIAAARPLPRFQRART